MSMQEKLATRVQNVGVSAIRKMMTLGSAVPGAISLAQGIPDSKTPAYVRRGVTELLNTSESIGKYSLSAGLPELRQLVADQLSTKSGFPVDPAKNICITAGAIEALSISMATLIEPGDEVILFDPGYPPYIEQIGLAGGTAVFVPLQPENGWKVDLSALEKAVTSKTKALIFSNPSNPTGMVMREAEIEAIAKLAAAHDFFVIADLTYEFLVYDHSTLPTLITHEEIRDRLLVCYSFSKEFSMTGWRLGYLFAPDYVMEQAMKVHDAFILCAPTVSQHAALVALTQKPSDDPEDMHADLAEKRELTCTRLDRLSDLFSYAKPEGAYYILAKYKKTDLGSMAFAIKMLNEAKVIVVPGIGFGPTGEGHIRISYGASKESLNEAFDRLEAWSKTL